MHDTKMVQVDMPDDASLNMICELAHLHVVSLYYLYIESFYIVTFCTEGCIIRETISKRGTFSERNNVQII